MRPARCDSRGNPLLAALVFSAACALTMVLCGAADCTVQGFTGDHDPTRPCGRTCQFLAVVFFLASALSWSAFLCTGGVQQDDAGVTGTSDTSPLLQPRPPLPQAPDLWHYI